MRSSDIDYGKIAINKLERTDAKLILYLMRVFSAFAGVRLFAARGPAAGDMGHIYPVGPMRVLPMRLNNFQTTACKKARQRLSDGPGGRNILLVPAGQNPAAGKVTPKTELRFVRCDLSRSLAWVSVGRDDRSQRQNRCYRSGFRVGSRIAKRHGLQDRLVRSHA